MWKINSPSRANGVSKFRRWAKATCCNLLSFFFSSASSSPWSTFQGCRSWSFRWGVPRISVPRRLVNPCIYFARSVLTWNVNMWNPSKVRRTLAFTNHDCIVALFLLWIVGLIFLHHIALHAITALLILLPLFVIWKLYQKLNWKTQKCLLKCICLKLLKY